MATEFRSMKHTLTIIWRIENIHFWESHNKELNASVVSSDFTPRLLDGNCFRLILSQSHPSGQEECVDKCLHLFLGRQDAAFDVPINCEVALIALDGTHLINDIVRNHVFNGSGMNVVFSSVINKEVFVNRRSNFLSQNNLTLQCRIWKSFEDFPEPEFFSLGSRVESVCYSFLWCIPGISTLDLNQEVTTPVRFERFHTANSFLVTFCFKGESLNLADMYVTLAAESIACRLPIVSWKLSLMTNNGKLRTSFEIKSKRPQSAEIPIIETLGRREDLFRNARHYLRDDILRIDSELSFFYINVVIEKSLYGYPNLTANVYLDTRSTQAGTDPINVVFLGSDSRDDIQNLYADKNVTDFVLCLGNVSFPVHKVVLSARSSLFRNMFSGILSQSKTNSMEIRNLDMHTLSQMLNFLYTGTVDGLKGENAVKLYYAANQYQVQSLQRVCRSSFISTINVNNVSYILQLADEHKDDELKSSAYSTISRHFHEVVNSPQWAKFMKRKPALAVKSMHQSYLKYIQNNNK